MPATDASPNSPGLSATTLIANLVRDYDWASTALGSMEAWPQSLRTTIDIILASGHAMCVMWGPERVFLYNDAYAPFLGKRHPAALGARTAEVWFDVWQAIEPLVDRTFAGETCTMTEMPLVMTRNGAKEETWWDFSYSPVRDEAGLVAGLLNVASDSTARVLTMRERDAAVAALETEREQQRLLNDELAHRIKNMFGVVQAIAFQTFGGTQDEAAVQTFEKRLSTLASAHDVLTGRNWSSALLGELARSVLETFDEDRFILAGPDVEIGSRAALSLSLMLHELATNAVKYGALTQPGGQIALDWSLVPDDAGERLDLCWTERGGPPVEEPKRKGFGYRLIRMGLTGSGGVELDYSTHGLTVKATAPLHLMQDV